MLLVANSPGIIDADYYNNPDNEGEIFIQLINLSPFDILIKKGDRIAQGIIQKYIRTADDSTTLKRTSGHGSTGTN
jgi:dUTP pyrophosphatase